MNIDLPDISVNVRDAGAGTPVVLLHGWPGKMLNAKSRSSASASTPTPADPDARASTDKRSPSRGTSKIGLSGGAG